MHYFGKKPSVNNENQNVEHMQNFGLLNSTCGNSIKSLQVRQRDRLYQAYCKHMYSQRNLPNILEQFFFCHIHVCDQRKKIIVEKRKNHRPKVFSPDYPEGSQNAPF